MVAHRKAALIPSSRKKLLPCVSPRGFGVVAGHNPRPTPSCPELATFRPKSRCLCVSLGSGLRGGWLRTGEDKPYGSDRQARATLQGSTATPCHKTPPADLAFVDPQVLMAIAFAQKATRPWTLAWGVSAMTLDALDMCRWHGPHSLPASLG